MAKKYNRVMLGRGGQFAEECRKGGFIGADFDISVDLTGQLPDNWRVFNKKFIPVWLKNNPEKSSNVAAGLACGFLWTICKGLQNGDIVLSPCGNGDYMVGEITGDYFYVPGTNLPHRRPITWYNTVIRRADMSPELKHSIGSIGTCSDATRFADEIEALLAGNTTPSAAPSVKPVAVAPKKYLERDLHPLFCTYLRDQEIFAKTIYHEKSSTSDKAQKWVHPDIIGVKESGLFTDASKTLQRKIDAHKSIQLISFEMKREINTDYDLKEYFFQALSNSSWANKGYLVAFDINEDLRPEIERLNAAFGIGIIQLQAHSGDTKVWYEAREKEIDYTTLDKLCKLNSDVNEFIVMLNRWLESPKSYAKGAKADLANICDEIFSTDAEIEKYCQDKNIPY